jgi:hypothetical protein
LADLVLATLWKDMIDIIYAAAVKNCSHVKVTLAASKNFEALLEL